MMQLDDRNRPWWPDAALIFCSRCLAIVLTAVLVTSCEPSDRTPGQWLRGTVVEPLPQDWAFTDEYEEIFVQVETPYFVPHAVTIWCAQVNGNLFIGAREPETKNWVGWMEKNRSVRLKIGDKLYDVAAADFSDDATLAAVRSAYAEKYNLTRALGGKNSNFRYWLIGARS